MVRRNYLEGTLFYPRICCRCGGPLTTEDVEAAKTFATERTLLVLLSQIPACRVQLSYLKIKVTPRAHVQDRPAHLRERRLQEEWVPQARYDTL